MTVVAVRSRGARPETTTRVKAARLDWERYLQAKGRAEPEYYP